MKVYQERAVHLLAVGEEEPLCTISSSRRRDIADRVGVDFAHFRRFVVPVVQTVLENTKRVDPQVLETQSTCYLDSVTKCLGKIRKRDAIC